MDEQWTPYLIASKIQQITQSGSPYIGSSAGVEESIRVNSAAEKWPDSVLEGVIRKGPMSAAHIKVFDSVLGERRQKRAAEEDQQYRTETVQALANLSRLAEIGAKADEAASRRHLELELANERRHEAISKRLDDLKKPHWSVTPNFLFTVLSAVAAVAAAYFAYLSLTR
jgi:hypothetical protein